MLFIFIHTDTEYMWAWPEFYYINIIVGLKLTPRS